MENKIKIEEGDAIIEGEYKIMEDISILYGERSQYWKPRKILLLNKKGKVNRIDYSFNKPLYISLVEGVNKDNLQEAVDKGEAIKIEVEEMVGICKEIGYLHEPTIEDCDDVVSWLFTTDEGDWYYETTISEKFTDDEKGIMEDKEDKGLIKCFKELIEASPRIKNSILYLTHNGVSNYRLQEVNSYLSIENHDDFVDFMYVSDSNEHDIDELLDKYDICNEVYAMEDAGDAYGKYEVTLRTGNEYEMITITRSYIDDWNSLNVVVKKGLNLPYPVVAILGEAFYNVENDLFVRFGVVI